MGKIGRREEDVPMPLPHPLRIWLTVTQPVGYKVPVDGGEDTDGVDPALADGIVYRWVVWRQLRQRIEDHYSVVYHRREAFVDEALPV